MNVPETHSSVCSEHDPRAVPLLDTARGTQARRFSRALALANDPDYPDMLTLRATALRMTLLFREEFIAK